jgi:hypothetical protein
MIWFASCLRDLLLCCSLPSNDDDLQFGETNPALRIGALLLMVAMPDVLAAQEELLLEVLLTLWCLLMEVPLNGCLELDMMVGIFVSLIVVIMVHNVPTKMGPYL